MRVREKLLRGARTASPFVSENRRNFSQQLTNTHKSEELSARSARAASLFVGEKRRNFFQELQFLIPRCMRKLNFDGDVSLLSDGGDDYDDDDVNENWEDSTSDVEEPTADYYPVLVSRRFEPNIVNAISRAVFQFAISPRASTINKSRSTSEHRSRSIIPRTSLCCLHVTEDEQSARINDWVLSTTMHEKQTSF